MKTEKVEVILAVHIANSLVKRKRKIVNNNNDNISEYFHDNNGFVDHEVFYEIEINYKCKIMGIIGNL